MFAALNVTTAIAWLRFFFGRAACDRNGLGIAFQAARPSCGAAACIAHDGEPGGSDREHDAVATVLIIGASRGIALRP